MCDISTFNMATFVTEKETQKLSFKSLTVYVEETGMSFKETNSSI